MRSSSHIYWGLMSSYTGHVAIKHLIAQKDAKSRLIIWVLLLQEFDIEIKDKKGSGNVITDYLSIIEKPIEDERGTEIEEKFPDEQLFQVIVQLPWYAELVNYLECGIMPPELTYQ